MPRHTRTLLRHSRCVLLACGQTLFWPAAAAAQSLPGDVFDAAARGPFVQQSVLPEAGTPVLDGDIAVVATEPPLQPDRSRLVWVYERDPLSHEWSRVAQIAPGAGSPGFGRALAIDGGTVVIGAEAEAYVFVRTADSQWREAARLAPADPDPQFGASVDVDDDRAIVSGTEAAYVFARRRGHRSWTQVAALVPAADDEYLKAGFGRRVRISGDTAVVVSSSAVGIYTQSQSRKGATTWRLARRHQGCQCQPPSADVNGDIVVIADWSPTDSSSLLVYARDHGGRDMWGLARRAPAIPGTDVEVSGDRAIFSARQLSTPDYLAVYARHQGGADMWGPIARMGPLIIGRQGQGRPAYATMRFPAIDGDAIVAFVRGPDNGAGIVVLTSDVDGDGQRDGEDPCPRDPQNNLRGGCRRAAELYPAVDDLVAAGELVAMPRPQRRRVLIATYVNTSGTAIRNPFFEVTSIGHGSVLENADGRYGGRGATLSPDVGDGVLSPGESMTVSFAFAGRRTAAMDFAVTLRGEPLP